MVDFGLLPPEINSGRIYTGAGSGPMLAAAAAWSGLAADLQGAASGHRAVISELTGGPWLGPASVAMLGAAIPFIEWLDGGAAEAEQAAGQAFAAAAAYEAAFAATVPPPVIAANRALLAALVATNFLGQNTPAIAATEALYLEFWAQDAGAMYTYAGSSAAATELTELPEPAEAVDPGGLVDQAIAAFKAQNEALQSEIIKVATQVNPRVTEVLRTLSAPINGTAIDQWLAANTPLDDLAPLWTKYGAPYVSSVTALFQSGQAFGQASSGSIAITNFAAPAAKAATGGAAEAATAGVLPGAKLGGSVGGVAAGLGRGASISGLTVPASWTSANAPAAPSVAALGKATAIPATLETAAAPGNTPVAPPFGQYFNAGNGRRTPAYGHRLTFMTRPPAAG